MLQKLFQKIENKGALSNLFCEASITLMPKLEKILEKMEERKEDWGKRGGRKEVIKESLSWTQMQQFITKY